MEEKFQPISLPSKCVVYDGVEPDSIKIRTLKGKDEKLIAELNYDNFDKKFCTIMNNVITGIEPEKLTIGDRLYIMLWETVNSYSKDYPVEFICDSCLQKIEYMIDLSKLDVVCLPDDFVEPYEVKLSSGMIKLRLFRISDEINISELEKAGKDSWLYRFALSIVDNEKNVWDRVIKLDNMDVKDIAIIRAFHTKFYHGPKLESKYECPKCGGEGVVPVPFRPEMLLPYGDALVRDFGKAI